MAKRSTAKRRTTSTTRPTRRVKFVAVKRSLAKKLREVKVALNREGISPRAQQNLRRAEGALDTLLRTRVLCGQTMVVDY